MLFRQTRRWLNLGTWVILLGLLGAFMLPRGVGAAPVLPDVRQANGLYYPGTSDQNIVGARAYIAIPSSMPYPPGPNQWTRMRVAVGDSAGNFVSLGWYRQDLGTYYLASEEKLAPDVNSTHIYTENPLNAGTLYYFEVSQAGSTVFWKMYWGPNGSVPAYKGQLAGPGGDGDKGLCGGGVSVGGVELGSSDCYSNQLRRYSDLAWRYTGAAELPGSSADYWGYTLPSPFSYYDWKVGGKCGGVCP